MAQSQTRKLDRGDLFPRMELGLTTGSSLVMPEATRGAWSVLLVYRGRW